MNASINFFLHLISFGLIFTSLLGGWLIERKFRSEKSWEQKIFIGTISRPFGLLSLVASVLMLLTGISNIFIIYEGNITLWYTSGWLIAKIILFAILLVNGAIFGPTLLRRRTKLIQPLISETPSEEIENNIKVLNKSISTFYLVQFFLLMIILYLSVVGSGKHPGLF